jgi:nucleoid DNA-binding protein
VQITILETMTEPIAAGKPLVLKDFGRFSTWERKQRIRGFDGQAHEVDEMQLAFKASAILRRRLKEKPSQRRVRHQQQAAESTLRNRGG